MLHGNERTIKHKVGLLNLGDESGNIAWICKLMGVFRGTPYRYQEAINDVDIDALSDNGFDELGFTVRSMWHFPGRQAYRTRTPKCRIMSSSLK